MMQCELSITSFFHIKYESDLLPLSVCLLYIQTFSELLLYNFLSQCHSSKQLGVLWLFSLVLKLENWHGTAMCWSKLCQISNRAEYTFRSFLGKWKCLWRHLPNSTKNVISQWKHDIFACSLQYLGYVSLLYCKRLIFDKFRTSIFLHEPPQILGSSFVCTVCPSVCLPCLLCTVCPSVNFPLLDYVKCVKEYSVLWNEQLHFIANKVMFYYIFFCRWRRNVTC